MGNSHSSSLTPRSTISANSESNECHDVSNPSSQCVSDTSEANQTPTEQGNSSLHTLSRRRSLMRFPSLRRRSRSVIALGDSTPDSQVIGSPPASRRRWRAHNGLKGRPVSTVAASSSPAADLQPPQESLHHGSADPVPTEKGKEREKVVSETVQFDGPNDLPEMHNDAILPRPSTGEDIGVEPSPQTVLQELRDMQNTSSTPAELQSNTDVDPNLENDAKSNRNQIDRPLTPIPISGMGLAPGPRDSDVLDTGSPIALAEALGSWMSGRPRTENPEYHLGNGPVASSSASHGTDPSPIYANAHYESSSVRSSETDGALGSSSSDPHSGNPVSRDGVRQLSSSPRGPTLPPTSTGTLVVVQGVVHTTDVRHSHSRTPSTSAPATTSSMHPSRSASSTPTPRASTFSPSPRSGSGTSMPQSPQTLRRSRFSSLASGFRQRSRPHTPTSFRTAGTGGWRHGAGDSDLGSVNHSESLSERNLGLGVSRDRGIYDFDTGSIALTTDSSSASAFMSVDDTPTLDTLAVGSSSGELQASTDSVASQEDSQARNVGDAEETFTSSNYMSEQRTRDDGERDSISDEDSEAELSASSIEILGTILSVATAATAASLVTGTTEPLFTSGLAGPPPNGRNATPVTPLTQHGSMNPISPFPRHHPMMAVGADNGTEAAINTRMRAAWESLRDRFSRTRGRGGTPSDAPGEARQDPREHLLREMARVVNMGLGLDAEDANEPRPAQQVHETSEAPPSEMNSLNTSQVLPESTLDHFNRSVSESRSTGPDPGPEGSFERFLHNLQVDLRTALTNDYAARRARAQARDQHASDLGAASSSAVSTPSPVTDTDSPVSPDSLHASNSEGSNQNTPVPRPSQELRPQVPDLIPTLPNTPRTANLDLPHLPGDIDSQYTDGSRTPPQAQGITGQPRAGIDWWRLHRFPPMQLPPHPSATTTATTDTSSAADIPSAPHAPSTFPQNSSRISPPDLDGNLPPQGSESPPTLNVIPVIAVGLQSIPVNRIEAHHHDLPSPNADGSTDLPSRDRDRARPLPAASRAFNRIGRRGDADLPPDSDMNPLSANPDENTGPDTRRTGRQSGRTYLIFVIGGYYPPNHSIVTGPDEMNSLEGLWELTDLLGQVKPPVASKEDIEKSGLEIIKSSGLFEYEKLGKVASNTVERCLICLDDYEPEDDLRLLSCRHIFHKSCVDRWLEQGRNNCPACRSNGVKTGDDLTTSPSPTAGMPLRSQAES